MKSKKPVSLAGNSWFARVYRGDDWVGPRSFAWSKYGGRDAAEATAWKWVRIADERLPVVPPKPILRKATVHLRTDSEDPRQKYYDVYIPPVDGETQWSRKFHFDSLAQPKVYKRLSEAKSLDFHADDMYRRISGVETIDLTTDEQEVARQKAEQLKDEINARLTAEHREALIAWHVEHDRIMDEISRLWPEIKDMQLPSSLR